MLRHAGGAPLGPHLCDVACSLLPENPQLFPFCAFLDAKRSLYTTLQPSPEWVACAEWAVPSIVAAIGAAQETAAAIFQFLIACSSAEWAAVFHTIGFCARAIDVDGGDAANRFLTTLAGIMIAYTFGQQETTVFFELVVFHMCFRDAAHFRSPLEDAFCRSPFDDSAGPPRTPPPEGCARPREYFNVVAAGGRPGRYVFGLRMDSDRRWLDGDLALLAMKVAARAGTQSAVSFGLTVAAWAIRHDPEFVRMWFIQLELSGNEVRMHASELRRLACASMATVALLTPPIEDTSIMCLANPPFALSESMVNAAERLAAEFAAVAKRSMNQGAFEASHEIYDNCRIRMARLMEEVPQELDSNRKAWLRFWSNLVVDNAPWDPSRISGEKSIPRWKRDPALFGYGVPMRMKRNRSFTSHIEASIARDAGNAVTAETQFKAHQQQLLNAYRATAPPEILEVRDSQFLRTTPEKATARSSQKVLSSFRCVIIKPKTTRDGTFQVHRDSVRIHIAKSTKQYQLKFTAFRKVLLRKRFHRLTGIEIFLSNRRAYFIDFPFNQAPEIVKSMPIPEPVQVQRDDFVPFFHSLHYTHLWKTGKLSNFQYLLALNLVAGRTFNDPSQYPIFPWTISDFLSESPNLFDRATFRDLSLPIGAIGPERLRELLVKQNDLKRFRGVGYLYSSYASCPLSVYLWLLRIEPYTTLHIRMQSQRFDHASRLFNSVGDAYMLATSHLNDYRELTPEFYCQPEFLYNDNDFDLGFSRGMKVNDVLLPPWAHGSGVEFVHTMRKALESDYVSEHLNDWIDLVFGYKQSGQPAIDANNVYSPDLYEAAWKGAGEERKLEIEAAMQNIGQIPTKLFTGPHPHRELRPQTLTFSEHVELFLKRGEVAAACFDQNTIYAFGDGVLVRYSIAMSSSPVVRKQKTCAMASDIHLMLTSKKNVLAVLHSARLLSIAQMSDITSFPELTKVTYIASSSAYVAIVSDDATLNLRTPSGQFAVPFYGDAMSCCAISKEYGIAVGGTVSGTIVTCSIHEGTKINVVHLGGGYRPVRILVTSSWGFILTYASHSGLQGVSHRIFVHNVNGRFICSVDLEFAVAAWCCLSSRKSFDYVVVADDGGRLYFAEAFDCRVQRLFPECGAPVVAVTYLYDSCAVLAATTDGRAVFLPLVVD